MKCGYGTTFVGRASTQLSCSCRTGCGYLIGTVLSALTARRYLPHSLAALERNSCELERQLMTGQWKQSKLMQQATSPIDLYVDLTIYSRAFTLLA